VKYLKEESDNNASQNLKKLKLTVHSLMKVRGLFMRKFNLKNKAEAKEGNSQQKDQKEEKVEKFQEKLNELNESLGEAKMKISFDINESIEDVAFDSNRNIYYFLTFQGAVRPLTFL
jgi:hypothetical protein